MAITRESVREFQDRASQFLDQSTRRIVGDAPEGEIDPRLLKYTHWLDDAFRVPGTRFRFGLDGIFGLIPFLGDLPGVVFTLWQFQEAKRLGVSRWGQVRMWGNSVLDFLLGSVPFLGDLFDFGFKANRRNLNIIERHLARVKARTQKGAG